MARPSYFVHFASALAAALFFLPAHAATNQAGALDASITLQSLVLEAQPLSINLVGP